MKKKIILILFLLIQSIESASSQNYEVEYKNMLNSIKLLIKNSQYYRYLYENYITDLTSNSSIISDYFNSRNKEDIKKKHRLPTDVMNQLLSVLSESNSNYVKITFKNSYFDSCQTRYQKIVGYAKRIKDNVVFTLINTIAYCKVLPNIQCKEETLCKKVLNRNVCNKEITCKDNGNSEKRIISIEKGLDKYCLLNMKKKLMMNINDRELIFSNENQLFSLSKDLLIKFNDNGLGIIYKEDSNEEIASFGEKSNENDGPYFLKVCSNGKINIQNEKNKIIWSSQNYGKGKYPYKLILNADSNIILIDKDNIPIWDRLNKYYNQTNIIIQDYPIYSQRRYYYVKLFNNGIFGLFNKEGEKIKTVKPYNIYPSTYTAHIHFMGLFTIVDENGKTAYNSYPARGVSPFSFTITDDGNFNAFDNEGTLVFSL
jgi:hypothetical protein